MARGGLVLLSSLYRLRCGYAVLLYFRICQMVKIGSATPKLSKMPKGGDRQGEIFHQPYFYIINIRILSECGV